MIHAPDRTEKLMEASGPASATVTDERPGQPEAKPPLGGGSANGRPGRARRRLRVVAVVVVAVAVTAGAGVLAVGWSRTDAAGPPRVWPEVPVTAMDLGAGLANNSPVLVADPTEERFVVMANRLDAPAFGCALQVSGDGGRRWVTAQVSPTLPPGADLCYAPEAAFGADGTLYFLFVGLQGSGNEPMGVFLTSSVDRAATWSPPRQVLGPRHFGVRMAVDQTMGRPGRIHLVWLLATSDPPLGGFGPPPNPIMAAHSDDGGNTFSSPVQVSDPRRLRVVAPSLALGRDGAVHVAYYDLQQDARDYSGLEGPVWDESWSVVVATSVDGDGAFTDQVAVDESVRPWARPMLIYTLAPPALAADRRGRLCAAWTDARNGDADALVACSGGDGGGWGPARRLNDDPVGNGSSQYLPQVAFSADGRLHAVFFDRSADPRNVIAHVRYAWAAEPGGRPAPTVRLTSEPSHSQIGQRYTNVSAQGQYEVGSRLGLLARRHDVIAAWPDGRHSSPGETSQDIFTTTVSRPDRRGGLGNLAGRAAIGAAAVAALLAGVSTVRRRRRRQRS